MSDLLQDLDSLLAKAREEIARSSSLAELDAIRVRLLGKSGEVTGRLKMLGSLAPDSRREAGAKINLAKDELHASLEARRAALEAEQLAQTLASASVDVTLPGRGQSAGGIHPVSRARRRIEMIFRAAGFEVAE